MIICCWFFLYIMFTVAKEDVTTLKVDYKNKEFTINPKNSPNYIRPQMRRDLALPTQNRIPNAKWRNNLDNTIRKRNIRIMKKGEKNLQNRNSIAMLKRAKELKPRRLYVPVVSLTEHFTDAILQTRLNVSTTVKELNKLVGSDKKKVKPHVGMARLHLSPKKKIVTRKKWAKQRKWVKIKVKKIKKPKMSMREKYLKMRGAKLKMISAKLKKKLRYQTKKKSPKKPILKIKPELRRNPTDLAHYKLILSGKPRQLAEQWVKKMEYNGNNKMVNHNKESIFN